MEFAGIGDNVEYIKSQIDVYCTHTCIHTHTPKHTHTQRPSIFDNRAASPMNDIFAYDYHYAPQTSDVRIGSRRHRGRGDVGGEPGILNGAGREI